MTLIPNSGEMEKRLYWKYLKGFLGQNSALTGFDNMHEKAVSCIDNAWRSSDLKKIIIKCSLKSYNSKWSLDCNFWKKKLRYIILWQAILKPNGALWLPGFWSGFYSTDHYHGKRSVSVFLLSPRKFKLSEREKVFKTWNLVYSHNSTIILVVSRIIY